jgi:putative peptidoglycan lipid II flippase
VLVGGGILLSRLAGLVRQRVLAWFLGLGPEADAFTAAFRLPNLLQNLFGEGALSASFIPVYARLRAAGDTEGARRVAGAVLGLLALVVSVVVLLGILLAPWLVEILLPGFEGAKRDLTVRLVRILYPSAGILVLSAWCLGVLNSHGRFFLSYAAPVAWNLAIIAALVLAGGRQDAAGIAVWAACGAVIGSLLQVAVQLPSLLALLGRPRLSLGRGDPGTAEVRRTFLPALLSRGVTQVGAYVDTLIASLLPTGAVAALVNAQMLYTLPVSLFGISVAAVELPAMAADPAAIRQRVTTGLERLAVFVVPSAVGFLGLGHLVVALVFQGGRFSPADVQYVWAVLAAASVGLLAATGARLLASASWALGDTKTPFRFALARIALATVAGFLAARYGPALVGIEARWGVAGLALASSAAAWLEYALLRRAIARRVGSLRLPSAFWLRVWGAAGLALGAAWLAGPVLAASLPTLVRAALGLGAFGVVYLLTAARLGVPHLADVLPGARSRG